MEYSEHLNLSLPSKNNVDDSADIDVISNNFRILDATFGAFAESVDEISALVGGAD